MLSTYHVFSLPFFFFPFPFLYCVDWIFFCWFESYIFLWLLLTYLAPYLTSLLSWILRVSAPSCLSPLSSPALVLWHLQGGFCAGTAALFLCHLAQNWARLLQALLGGTPLLSRSRRFYAGLGAGGFQGGGSGRMELCELCHRAGSPRPSEALPQSASETSTPCFQLHSQMLCRTVSHNPQKVGNKWGEGALARW